MGTSCNFSSSTPRPSPSPTRLRLVGLGLGLGVLERSRPSTPPPAVVLIPKYVWLSYALTQFEKGVIYSVEGVAGPLCN